VVHLKGQHPPTKYKREEYINEMTTSTDKFPTLDPYKVVKERKIKMRKALTSELYNKEGRDDVTITTKILIPSGYSCQYFKFRVF